MLNEQEKAKLQNEIEIAEKARVAFDHYFSPYFEKKEADLMAAFRSAPIGDREHLNNIHGLFKAIDAIKNDLLSSIETGKLAAMMIAADQEEISK